MPAQHTPVKDAPHKWADERSPDISTCSSLQNRKVVHTSQQLLQHRMKVGCSVTELDV
jgi:hypothetical protein